MTSEALTLNDEVWQHLQEATAAAMNPCYQCGTCTAVCPINTLRKEPYNVRKYVRSAQLGLKQSSEDLWLCATCKLCEAKCPRGVRIVDAIRGLKLLAYAERKAPNRLETVLWNVYEEGNSSGGKHGERGKWAEGLNIKDADKGVKVLFYVGCASSFDSRLRKTATSMAKILATTGVDFGILGNQEKCCGDVIYHIGEESFLEELIESNTKLFEKTHAEVIVTLSPHCSNMFKNVYPRFGLQAEAMHYTEYLAKLWGEGKLQFKEPSSPTTETLTYHDPCYLGRYNGVYEEPRRILENLKGVTLVEMQDSMENALCCGGGGGRMMLETAPEERFSNVRVKQAAETGAAVMTTSCPYCIQNFEDSVKTQRISGLRILDIAEIIASRLE